MFAKNKQVLLMCFIFLILFVSQRILLFFYIIGGLLGRSTDIYPFFTFRFLVSPILRIKRIHLLNSFLVVIHTRMRS